MGDLTSPFGFKLKPSKLFASTLILVHGAIVVAFLGLPLTLPWSVRLGIVILVLVNLVRSLRHYVLLKAPKSIILCETYFSSDPVSGSSSPSFWPEPIWRLTLQSGQQVEAELDYPNSTLTKSLIMLKFKTKNAPKQLTMVLLPDTISSFEFRHLRAYLASLYHP